MSHLPPSPSYVTGSTSNAKRTQACLCADSLRQGGDREVAHPSVRDGEAPNTSKATVLSTGPTVSNWAWVREDNLCSTYYIVYYASNLVNRSSYNLSDANTKRKSFGRKTTLIAVESFHCQPSWAEGRCASVTVTRSWKLVTGFDIAESSQWWGQCMIGNRQAR